MRGAFRTLARALARALLRLTVTDADYVPPEGGLLLAMNHLGDVDAILVIAFAPREVEVIGKAEIMTWPLVGMLARAYGMLPVRRGRPDRETLAAALDILQSGGALLVAPEGRESRARALQPAKGGAAFLAIQAGVPIVPVAITGTESVYSQWLRLRRPCVTLTFGPPFTLPPPLGRRAAADFIMRRIAAMLPERYRGAYGS